MPAPWPRRRCACNSGHCPVGITTQSESLRQRIEPDIAAERVANFYNGTRNMLEDYLRLMGYTALTEVSREDLLPLTPAAEALLEN